MKIGIILGSTRPGRQGEEVAHWVVDRAELRDDAEYEFIDLADYELDLLAEPTIPGAANREYENAATRRWGAKIDECDGFVFVTPEYNHGVPAAFKNAIDVLYPEWGNKSVGFVGYGAMSGARAVEQWRLIVANLSLYGVRQQVALSTFTDFKDGELLVNDRINGDLTVLFDQVAALAGALESLRA